MITAIVIKIFLTVEIILFIIGTIGPVIAIKIKGMNPHGTHEGASILTRISILTIMSWLIYVILYMINDGLILGFLPLSLLTSDINICMGMLIAIIGFIIEGMGILALGEHFRIELPLEDTKLITKGIYKITRNPIVLGIFLLLIGSFLIIPTVFSILLLILNLITFNSKVRDEEQFLEKRFGEQYESYKKNVGRYLPFLSIRKN